MRRDDFPVLDEVTYLDSACMSLRPEPVIEKIEEYYREYPACSGRSAHSLSKKASKEFERARERVASLIDAEKSDIVFTSGTTESINTVSRGFDFEKVYITDKEHNSNLVPWQSSEKEIMSTENGLNLSKLDSRLGEGDLVSITHVSNLDGEQMPVKEVSRIVRENDAYLMVDGAQSVPHQPFSVREIKPDFLAFSGHKMLGPSGTGALYVSDRVKEKLEPLKTGGGAVKNSTYDSAEFREFPHRMESGLPNLAGFIGFGAAAKYLEDVGMKKIARHEEKLTDKLREGVEEISGIDTVLSKGRGIVSFTFENVSNHEVAIMLDQRDVAVRSGQHCVHSWFDGRELDGTVRASLHLYNNEEDVEDLLSALKEIAMLN